MYSNPIGVFSECVYGCLEVLVSGEQNDYPSLGPEGYLFEHRKGLA